MKGVKGTGSQTERNKRWLAKNPNYMLYKQREWRARNPGYLGPKRQGLVDRINAIKEATPCTDCGGLFEACCMDFDHRGTDKHEEVGVLVSRTKPWQVIEAEIAKCDIVCANCHRIRTRDKGSAAWSRKRAPAATTAPQLSLVTIEKDEQPKSLARKDGAA
jgi:hypothetical protein